MKAAVFCRNMGMSGTCSTVMTAVARLTASWCGLANVPAVAYTSIMGMLILLCGIRTVAIRPAGSCLCRGAAIGCRLDQVGHFGWVGDHRDVAGGDFDGGRAHAAGEHALGVGRDRLVLRGDQVPARQRLPRWDAHH